METPLSRNVTLLVGVPPAVLVTVAVKVTDWPPTEDGSDEVTTVTVALRFTTWDRALEVLGANLLSPP